MSTDTRDLHHRWAQCPDCGVNAGVAHHDGCDVARCTHCGRQYLMCGHPTGAGQIFTGRWPGDLEVEEGLADDLNDLARKGLITKELVWDGQRWQQPVPA